MTDRAVSDVVGFVLVFALVVSTIGIVTMVGFSSLETQENAEQLNNVERAFDVFQNNVEDVYRDGAPSRATEMRLAGGTLRYGDSVNITVSDANDESINTSIRTVPLVYSKDGTDIVYVGGAVIREQNGSSVMLKQPPFHLTSERTVLPLVETSGLPGTNGITLEGTLRVRAIHLEAVSEPDSSLESAGKVNITVQTERTDAWSSYFTKQSDESEEPLVVDDEVIYTHETEELSTPLFRLLVEFDT